MGLWGGAPPAAPNFGTPEVYNRAAQLLIACNVLFRIYSAGIEKLWPSSFQRGHFARNALRWENAARLTGVTHAIIVTALAIHTLLAQINLTGNLQYDLSNSVPQHALYLEWACPLSLAYFVHDTGYILADYFYLEGPPASPKRRDGTTPDQSASNTQLFARPKRLQTLFLLHHVACITYVLLCLHTGRGIQTLCAAILLGEITNPLQNIWFFSRDIGQTKLYNILTHAYTGAWIIARCIACPIWSLHIIWFLVAVPNAFPVAAARTMAFICAAVNIAGLLWTRQIVRKYERFLKRQKMM